MLKNNKLCLRVIGGLGNQLFSYAYARSLAEKTGRKLVLDNTTGFIKDSYKRKPRVKSFLLEYDEASSFEKIIFFLTKFFPRTSSVVFNSIYQKERDFRSFESCNLEAINDVGLLFIQGYFQSHLYFNEFEEQIKSDIKLNFHKTEEVQDLAAQITCSNSVSIHVRRVQYSDLLDLDYYLRAIEIIKGSIENPVFFIFSDDMAWCKNNFPDQDPLTFITHDVNDEVTDLWLMTQCKHHIVANSSFSWWGAWLSKHSDKIVVAPGQTQIGVKDNLYPKCWILT